MSVCQYPRKGLLGSPVQIIDIKPIPGKPSRLDFKKDVLSSILKDVGTTPLHVLSIAGASKQGKSFFMTILVNLLSRMEQGLDMWEDLLQTDQPSPGFDFENGIERTTVGFWTWSKPFIIKRSDGSKLAVLLVDTQGVFDQYTNERDWATIVGLAVLTSSTVIYNLMNNMLDNTLTILKNFLEFGMLTLRESDDENVRQPFQKLIFLIRDWNIPDSCPFGVVGGQTFLHEKLKITPGMSKEGKEVRELIRSCFEEIDCFLLPHPGSKAIQNDYNGKLSDLDKNFLKNLRTFTEQLIVPDAMRTTIQGQEFRASMLITLFDKFVKAFNSIRLPEAKTLITLSMEAKGEALCDKLVDAFKEGIRKEFQGLLYIEPSRLKLVFQTVYKRAIALYMEQSVVLKSEKVREKYSHYLTKELIALHHNLSMENERKEAELLNETCQEALGIFAKKMEDALGQSCLLPEQYESSRRSAEVSAIETIHNKLQKYPVLIQSFEQHILPEIGKIESKFRDENEKRMTHIEKQIKDFSQPLVENYVNTMTTTKMNSGVHWTQEKLMAFHNMSQERALSKFHDGLKSLPGNTNKFLIEREVGKFKAQIKNALGTIAQEVAAENEKVEARCSQLMQNTVEKFKATIIPLIQNSNDGSLEMHILLHKSLCLSELNSLYAISQEKAQEYIARTSQMLEQFILSIKTQLKEKEEHFQKKLEQLFAAARQDFEARIKSEVIQQIFENPGDFKQACSKIRQEITKQVENGLKQFPEKYNSENLKSSFRKQIDETVESHRKTYFNKMEEEKANLRFALNREIQQHEEAMVQFLETINDPKKLEQFHAKMITECEQKYKASRTVSKKAFNQELEIFKGEMRKVYEYINQTLSAKIQSLVSHVQNKADQCLQIYAKGMSLRCHDTATEDEINRYHEEVKRTTCAQLDSTIDPKLPQTERDRHISQLAQRLDEERLKLIQESRKMKKKDSSEIDRLKSQIAMEFEEDAKSIIASHSEPQEVRTLIMELMDSKLDEFEDSFPRRSVQRLRSEKLKVKDNLRNVRESILSSYQQKQSTEKDMAERLAVEFSGNHLKQLKEHLLQNGLKVAVSEDDVLTRSSSIQKQLESEIENRNDLSRQQKTVVIEKARGLFMKNLQVIKQETAELLENAQIKMAQLLSNCENVLEESSQNVRNAGEFQPIFDDVYKQLENSVSASNLGVSQKLLPSFTSNLQQWRIQMEEKFSRQVAGVQEYDYLLQNCKATYHEEMKAATRDDKYILPQLLEEHHRKASKKAQEKLNGKPPAVINAALNSLKLSFREYVDLNDMRKGELEGVAIGIDLGTTYSCAAVYRKGGIEMIPNEVHSFITPSYVLYKEGEVVVGKVAKNQAVLYPRLVVFDAKRLIGRKYDDKVTQKDIKLWPFEVVSDNNRPRIKIADKKLFPEQVSAEVLKKLKNDAEAYLHSPVKKAVITVPAYFSDAQKQATRDAGELAGLEVLGIISEPTSAAIAYSLSYTDEVARNVFVYDLGGGTFDVSVLRICKGNVEVKAVGGNNHLGGQDFDSAMLNHCLEEFKKETEVDLAAGKRDIIDGRLRRIRHTCEQEKINLSVVQSVKVVIEGVCDDHTMNVEFTQDKFNELNAADFQKTIDIVKKALQDAKLKAEEIDDVVLVGGSTRIPKVKQMLQEVFPDRMLKMQLNPDEVVARGAAIYAAIQNGKQARQLGKIEFSDVAPLSLGIHTVGDVFSRIIDRNTKIPVKKKKPYYTAEDNQTVILVQVYEGEDDVASQNNLLGKFSLSGIPKAPKGKEEVEVTMQLNKEGILQVSAVIKSTGGKQSIKVKAIRNNLSDEEKKELLGN